MKKHNFQTFNKFFVIEEPEERPDGKTVYTVSFAHPTGKTLKSAREKAGLTQKKVAEHLSVPVRTIQNWEQGYREAPEYLLKMYLYVLYTDFQIVPDIKTCFT